MWKQISWKLAEVTWKSAVWNLKWMVFEEVLNGYGSSCFETHTTQIAGWSSATFTASFSYLVTITICSRKVRQKLTKTKRIEVKTKFGRRKERGRKRNKPRKKRNWRRKWFGIVWVKTVDFNHVPIFIHLWTIEHWNAILTWRKEDRMTAALREKKTLCLKKFRNGWDPTLSNSTGKR